MIYSAWNRNGRPFGLPKWQIVALLVVAASVGIAVAVVATGVFLILLPIVALAAFGYRLFGGPKRRPAGPRVIEGEYEVVHGTSRTTRPRSGQG